MTTSTNPPRDADSAKGESPCGSCASRRSCQTECDRITALIGPSEIRTPREFGSAALMEGRASYASSGPVFTDEQAGAEFATPGSVIEDVRRAIDELSPQHRAVVDEYIAGARASATAAKLGISKNIEREARAHGLQRLRARLLVLGVPSSLGLAPPPHSKGKPMPTPKPRSRKGVPRPMHPELATMLANIPPLQARVVEMTPSIAASLLERNPANRSIAHNRVARFASDMTAGVWEVNNNAVGIGDDGELYDGQHRLLAVVRANQVVRMSVMRGLTRESRTTIDQGRPRSVGDNLRILDGELHGVRIVAWLNAIESLESRKSVPLSHAMVRERVARFEPGIRWFAQHGPTQRPYYRAGVIGGLIFAFKAFPEQVQDFARRYTSGAEIPEGSPILVLRSYVADPTRIRPDLGRTIALKTLTTVAAYVRGETIKHLVASEEVVNFFQQR